jgi:DNA-binding transcriptional MerR regulator
MSETKDIGSNNLNNNIDEMQLTVKEAAQYIGESAGVIRNWMRELKPYIPTIKGENGYHYFDKASLERLLLIKKLSREQNYSIKQIEYHFISDGKTVKPEPKLETSELILKELQEIKTKLELQEQFNKVLVGQLEKQQKHIDDQQKLLSDSLNNRDEQLLLAIKESQQVQEEAAASTHKKGFLERAKSLFNKK